MEAVSKPEEIPDTCEVEGMANPFVNPIPIPLALLLLYNRCYFWVHEPAYLPAAPLSDAMIIGSEGGKLKHLRKIFVPTHGNTL